MRVPAREVTTKADFTGQWARLRMFAGILPGLESEGDNDGRVCEGAPSGAGKAVGSCPTRVSGYACAESQYA